MGFMEYNDSDKHLLDYNIDIGLFQNILKPKYLTNSYKLYWFAGIFDELISKTEVDKSITFHRIVSRMVAKSWYSILEFKLNLGAVDKLHELVQVVYEKSGFKINASESEIINFIENSSDPELKDKITDLYKYVSYRLLTPFFENRLKGIADHKKNDAIVKKSLEDENSLYKIIELDQYIIMNDKWLLYILSNQAMIGNWINYMIVDFLQNRNPNVPGIIHKISAPKKRDLSTAIKYWKTVNKKTHIIDIYSNKKIINTDISIDHFIPWSYVSHDKIWNLTPTTSSINSSKSDNLPEYNTYIKKFCELQYKGFMTALSLNIDNKILEDYLTLNGEIELNKNFPEKRFKEIIKETIYPIYQLAQNQGFTIWENN